MDLTELSAQPSTGTATPPQAQADYCGGKTTTMENVFYFGGSSVGCRPSVTSTDQKDELVRSLKSFLELYDQREVHLQRALEAFSQAAAQLRGTQGDRPLNKTILTLLGVGGGALGAVCGGVFGGAGGAMGAIGAATCVRLCGRMDAVSATVGFFGSVLGGVAGGAFSGGVGGAAGAAALATGRSFHGVVADVVWFTTGYAAGGAIGCIFGGTVGTAGGAVGGGFSALIGTRLAISLFGVISDCFLGTSDLREGKKATKEVNAVRKTGGDFSETIKPLVGELKTIRTIGEKIGSRDDKVQSVMGESGRTLAEAAAMEATLGDSRTAVDAARRVSAVEAAAEHGQRVHEGLKMTNAEVKKLVESLIKR